MITDRQVRLLRQKRMEGKTQETAAAATVDSVRVVISRVRIRGRKRDHDLDFCIDLGRFFQIRAKSSVSKH